jgi:hypothetical protein
METQTKAKRLHSISSSNMSSSSSFSSEEFYIMKRYGDVVMYDANSKTETVKIANEDPPLAATNAAANAGNPVVPVVGAGVNGPINAGAAAAAAGGGPATQQQQQPPIYPNEYQLFVNRKEQGRTDKFEHLTPFWRCSQTRGNGGNAAERKRETLKITTKTIEIQEVNLQSLLPRLCLLAFLVAF